MPDKYFGRSPKREFTLKPSSIYAPQREKLIFQEPETEREADSEPKDQVKNTPVVIRGERHPNFDVLPDEDEVDLNNIIAGQRFKNYKELCAALHEKEKTGTSKIAQLKRWERFFSYEREGQGYRITDIYETPQSPVSFSQYYDYLHKSLLFLFDSLRDKSQPSPDGGLVLSFSKSALMRYLGLVNGDYSSANVAALNKTAESIEKQAQEAIETGVPLYDLPSNKTAPLTEKEHWVDYFEKEFFKETNSFITGILERSLNKLEARRNLYYSKTFHLIDKAGNPRPAITKEKNTIYRIQSEVLRELGFSSETDAITHGQWKAYYDQTQKRVAKELNIHNYYNAYEITVIERTLERDIKALKAQGEEAFFVNGPALTLNSRVVNALRDKSAREVNKFVEGELAPCKKEAILRHCLAEKPQLSVKHFQEKIREAGNIYSDRNKTLIDLYVDLRGFEPSETDWKKRTGLDRYPPQEHTNVITTEEIVSESP